MVIIVGTHLDRIPLPDHDEKIRRYKDLIEQCFSNKYCPDLPNYWPRIDGVYFVGLKHHRPLAPYLNVDELRDHIYYTALNLELPIGMYVFMSACVFMYVYKYPSDLESNPDVTWITKPRGHAVIGEMQEA